MDVALEGSSSRSRFSHYNLITSIFYIHCFSGLLNPDDENHLFSLHYVFLPRINRHLQHFKDAYARHRIRTARNRTPMQLWVEGHLTQSWGPERDDTLTEVVYMSVSDILLLFTHSF